MQGIVPEQYVCPTETGVAPWEPVVGECSEIAPAISKTRNETGDVGFIDSSGGPARNGLGTASVRLRTTVRAAAGGRLLRLRALDYDSDLEKGQRKNHGEI